jgi:hypothetical protein
MPEKTAPTGLPHMPAVFSTHHRPLRAWPPIPSSSTQHLSGHVEIVGCAGGWIQTKGCNFGAPLQCTGSHPLLVHRNCWHVRLGLNPCVTISTDFFGYFLSRKESNILGQDAIGPTNETVFVLRKVRHYDTFNLRQFLLHFFNERKLSQEN